MRVCYFCVLNRTDVYSETITCNTIFCAPYRELKYPTNYTDSIASFQFETRTRFTNVKIHFQ